MFCANQKTEFERSGGTWTQEEEIACQEDCPKLDKADSTGKLKATPEIKFPEISTLYGFGKYGKLGFAIGVELFHDRSKERKHKWKFELQLAQDEVAFGVSRILVRGANFTVGPYIGYDVEIERSTYGLRFGLFKF